MSRWLATKKTTYNLKENIRGLNVIALLLVCKPQKWNICKTISPNNSWKKKQIFMPYKCSYKWSNLGQLKPRPPKILTKPKFLILSRKKKNPAKISYNFEKKPNPTKISCTFPKTSAPPKFLILYQKFLILFHKPTQPKFILLSWKN